MRVNWAFKYSNPEKCKYWKWPDITHQSFGTTRHETIMLIIPGVLVIFSGSRSFSSYIPHFLLLKHAHCKFLFLSLFTFGHRQAFFLNISISSHSSLHFFLISKGLLCLETPWKILRNNLLKDTKYLELISCWKVPQDLLECYWMFSFIALVDTYSIILEHVDIAFGSANTIIKVKSKYSYMHFLSL